MEQREEAMAQDWAQVAPAASVPSELRVAGSMLEGHRAVGPRRALLRPMARVKESREAVMLDWRGQPANKARVRARISSFW